MLTQAYVVIATNHLGICCNNNPVVDSKLFYCYALVMKNLARGQINMCLCFPLFFFMLPSSFVFCPGGSLIPYGLPCLRELFRFLISLTNPHDRHNTDTMMHMGLQLLTVALESGHIANYQSLLVLVKDELCRHLLQVLEEGGGWRVVLVSLISFLYFLAVTLQLFLTLPYPFFQLTKSL